MQATLTSTKATTQVTGDLAAILTAAIAAEEELQPVGGIDIECDDGRTFECINGFVPLESAEGEAGTARMVGGTLMILWEQHVRTQFADTGLIPA